MWTRVYHLIDEKWGLEALRLRRLKLSLLDDMNDPFELFAVSLGEQQDRVDFRQLKAEMSREIGVLCFSRSWSNPVLWSHYADRHKGICLAFDVPTEFIKEVTYVRDRFDPADENESIGYRLLTTKYEHWRYEEEVRIVLRLNGIAPEDSRYFVPFSDGLCLRAVITGPRSELSTDDLRKLIRIEDRDVNIIHSRLAFRSFKVVKNLAKNDA